MSQTRHTSDKVVLTETVSVKLRTELYIYMYEIAKEHATFAKDLDGKDMRAEIKESMISIILAYTCLEAYINTIGIDNMGEDWVRYEGSPTESRWIGISNALATKKLGKPTSVFNKKEEPFKSFLKLEEIRESLVHRKASFGEPVPTKYGNTDGTINSVNCDTAQWACTTVRDMVRTINKVIDTPPSETWIK